MCKFTLDEFEVKLNQIKKMITQNDDELRSLRNKLSDLNVQLVNLESDLKRVLRQKDDHQLKVRRLTKEIKRKKMELDELQKLGKTFDKKEFELNNEKRLIKKKIEELMAQLRMFNNNY